MRVIKYNTEQDLDAADSDRLKSYKEDVGNVNAERFSLKFNYNGGWCSAFSPHMTTYYTAQEIAAVEEIQLPEDFII